MEGFPGEKKSKPKKVRDAMKKSDIPYLSELGKRGAEIANKKQAEKRADKEMADEFFDVRDRLKAEKEAQKQLEATNEHIAPIDPEDQAA